MLQHGGWIGDDLALKRGAKGVSVGAGLAVALVGGEGLNAAV